MQGDTGESQHANKCPLTVSNHSQKLMQSLSPSQFPDTLAHLSEKVISVAGQVANGVPEERYAVVYKRPSDLALLRDLPICANLLIADMFDEGARMPARRPYLSACMAALWCRTLCRPCRDCHVGTGQGVHHSAGLLTSGILPAMRHCCEHLLADDAVLIPASATVYVQACNRTCMRSACTHAAIVRPLP